MIRSALLLLIIFTHFLCSSRRFAERNVKWRTNAITKVKIRNKTGSTSSVLQWRLLQSLSKPWTKPLCLLYFIAQVWFLYPPVFVSWIYLDVAGFQKRRKGMMEKQSTVLSHSEIPVDVWAHADGMWHVKISCMSEQAQKMAPGSADMQGHASPQPLLMKDREL